MAWFGLAMGWPWVGHGLVMVGHGCAMGWGVAMGWPSGLVGWSVAIARQSGLAVYPPPPVNAMPTSPSSSSQDYYAGASSQDYYAGAPTPGVLLPATASTPGVLLPATRTDVRFATYNVGLADGEKAFSTMRDRYVVVVNRMFTLLEHAHIVGINELHPFHQAAVRTEIESRHAVAVGFEAVACGDAVLWCPGPARWFGAVGRGGG